ncbi:restriction endonuclease subunit S [Clostridium sp. JNZ J1-5]
MSNISKQRLMSLKIPVPPIELQNQFAAFVNQVDKLKFSYNIIKDFNIV